MSDLPGSTPCPSLFLSFTISADFAGESQILEGPATVYDNQFWYYGAVAGPSSFRCRCVQEPVTCQPEDDFDVSSIEL